MEGKLRSEYDNSDPTQGGWVEWSQPISPSPGYVRPATVLVNSTRLVVAAETAGQITALWISIERDSDDSISGFQIQSTTVLDSSGNAHYPSAILAHNGDILVVWKWISNDIESGAKTLHWSPTLGWENFNDTSSLPDDAILFNPGTPGGSRLIIASLIERQDNYNVYLIGNLGWTEGSLVFNKASFVGDDASSSVLQSTFHSGWNWGKQDLPDEAYTEAGKG